MRIALVGYGAMGHAVERQALHEGHKVTHRLNTYTELVAAGLNATNTDVVIEFTLPTAVLANLQVVLPLQLPVVVGTTGWAAQLPAVQSLVQTTKGALLYGSNFSIGVNILFRINKLLAQLMNAYSEYDVCIEERHHRHKMDAPSGTALQLAQGILQANSSKKRWVLTGQAAGAPVADELSISAVRAGQLAGTHTVSYLSPTDQLQLSHQAFTKEGFATGALLAARWLVGKQGLYRFEELFENL